MRRNTIADLPTYLAAFSLGLSASFYPCLFPILPSFVAYLVNAHDKWWRGLFAGSLVTLGIMTVFVVMGLIFSNIIDILSPYYSEFRFLQGFLLMLLGGMITTNFSLRFGKLDSASSAVQGFLEKYSNEWIKSYLIGLFFAALAAPCAIIVFITIFTLTATESIPMVILLMIIFSLGAGMPFLIMGTLIPQLKDNIIQFDVQKIRKTSLRIAGIIVAVVGFYLVVDSLGIL